MSKSHSFSVEIAAVYNVEIALMLNHFCFWYEKVVSDGINKHKNEHWVRMKLSQMHHQFPYWGESKIRHLVDKMIAEKLIKKDEFNDKKNDRTKWYTLTQKSKKLLKISVDKICPKAPKKVTAENDTYLSAEIGTLSAEIGNSIYKEVDIKDIYYYSKEKILANKSLLEILAMQNKVKIETLKSKINEFALHSKSIQKTWNNDSDLYNHFASWIRKLNLKDIDLEKELNWFIEIFNKISKREYFITEITKQRFSEVFTVGYSGEQMAQAVKNLYSSSVKNKWHRESSYKFATPEYLLKAGNMGKYLNLKF